MALLSRNSAHRMLLPAAVALAIGVAGGALLLERPAAPPDGGATPQATRNEAAPIPLTAGHGENWEPVPGFEAAATLPDPTPSVAAAPMPLPSRAVIAREVEVRRGDTLMEILLRLGIPRAQAHEAIASLRTVYDPRRLRAGQYLTVELERLRSQEKELRLAGLSLAVDFATRVRLARTDAGGFEAATLERPLLRRPALASGTISGSLYKAAGAAGVPGRTLAELVRLFSWDIDFQRDIRPGDRFTILYEEVSTPDRRQRRGGAILYAAFELGGERLTAYRFTRRDGTTGYYDRSGKSVRKSLMRTPVDGARLSSRFGKRRHPVLGYTRMHKGVDFAAPRGTPIYAAGDGTVTFAGRNKGYGNYVRIRHNGTYTTAYAHMQRIAKGIRRGVRVRQGQVIGYVGATGLVTGPHLHYEVLRNGRQVNPLKLKQVAADALRGADRVAFARRVAEIDALRARLAEERMVAEARAD